MNAVRWSCGTVGFVAVACAGPAAAACEREGKSMNRVVHFEIHADVPDRAVSFYSRLFGWKFSPWGGTVEYSMIETGPRAEAGIDGGLLPRSQSVGGQSVRAYVCTVEIEDIEQTIGRAQSMGATLVQAKMPIPGIGWLAYLRDTEGNTFGVMQPDPGATASG